jgi:hypothetical protein
MSNHINKNTHNNLFYADDDIVYPREIDAFVFCNFCIEGNLPEVQKYCKNFQNFYTFRALSLSGVNYEGCTGFMLACAKGNIKIAKWIYSQYPEVVNITNVKGYTIYDYIDIIKNDKVIKWLISINPEINLI